MKSALKRLLCIIACMALVMAFSTNAMAAGKIKDGTYIIGFSFTGGSGKATATSATLIVSGGKMQVKITMSSPNFTKAVVGGATYKNQSAGSNSTFTFPVSALDSAMTVTATTVAMSQPHDIDYQLTLNSSSLPASAFQEDSTPSQSKEQPKVEPQESETEKTEKQIEECKTALMECMKKAFAELRKKIAS